MRAIFWLSALGIGYVYVGYPMLLAVWAWLRPRPVPTAIDPDRPLPRVSIVVAARNEAERLPARIANLLALRYPSDRRELIVVSDGSTDGTMDALSAFGDQLRAIDAPACGKAEAINAGVALATGDILVFADARQTFAPDALTALVAPFADPTVGGVTGELLLDSEPTSAPGRRGGRQRRGPAAGRRHSQTAGRRVLADRRDEGRSAIAEGVGLYWRYEKQLRRFESAVGSTLGATGAIYALRRALYRPLPAGTILDDVLTPMRAVLEGSRVVFSDRAFAFDRSAADRDVERRRKVRTLAGNFQILRQEPRLLVPIVNPVWLQYVSHKLGRLFVPYALVSLFLASALLAPRHPFYAVALAIQSALYLLAGYGAWLDAPKASRPAGARTTVERLARVALMFLDLNYSAVAGLLSVVTRRTAWR